MPSSPAQARFPHLLTPLQLRHLTLRNRVFSSGHGTGFAAGGGVSDRLVAYHQARARGGIGLIVTEATAVDESPLRAWNLRNVDDRIIPGYRRLADAVHAEGARIFGLLSHSGRNSWMDGAGTPPRAASPVPMDRSRDIPHELEIEEIAGIVQAFAAAARRCRDGGLDGVELSFTHGNLVQEFLSPRYNLRTDAYGGSEANRLRLAREVLQACRAALGPDAIFGIRFSASEVVPGGYTLDDGVRYAPLLVEWGQLDFLDVSAGTNADMRSRPFHYPSIGMPHRPLVHMAKAVRDVVPVPVFCVGKIADPMMAEAILAAGEADMVAMTRAHIADPAIVRKLTAGTPEDIRTCIYCNESCFGRQQRYGDISCVYNPRTGRESIWPPLQPAAARRRVLVVGGGPAGLEAARVAAKRGHCVELHEQDSELGGQVRLLLRTPTRAVYGEIITWLERQVRRHGVAVHLNSRMTAERIRAQAPDAVIIATGAADAMPPVPGAHLPHVHTARQVLAGATLGRRVAVCDWDGKHMGMSVAETIAAAGHAVELITPAFYVGMDADLMTWRPAYERLLGLGVRITPLHDIAGIEQGGVTIARADGATHTIAADSVVLCTRGAAERSLYRALRGEIANLHAIGDCWAPRQIEQAIAEGATVAREL